METIDANQFDHSQAYPDDLPELVDEEDLLHEPTDIDTKDNFSMDESQYEEKVTGEPKTEFGKNMQIFLSFPASWGYIFWPVLHYMGWDEDFDKYCVENICDVLPCPSCQVHCTQYRLEHIDDEKDFEYTFHFHNAVSERLGKEGITFDEAERMMIDSDYIDKIYREHIPMFLSIISLRAALLPEKDRELHIEYLTRFLKCFDDEHHVACPEELHPDLRGKDYFNWVCDWLELDSDKQFIEIVKRFNIHEVQAIGRADQMRKEDNYKMKVMKQVLEERGIDVDKATLHAEVKLAQKKVEELEQRDKVNEKSFKSLQEELTRLREQNKKLEEEGEDDKNQVYLYAAIITGIICVILMLVLFFRK